MAGSVSVGPAPAGFDRFDDLLALIRRAFAAHAGRIDPPSSSTRDAPESLRALATAGWLHLAIAADGLIVGCVFARPDGEACYLSKLAVDPGWQRQGIARRLMQAAIADARAAGFARATLGVRLALAENIRLFEGLGFVRTGEKCHPGYTTPTSVDMLLAL